MSCYCADDEATGEGVGLVGTDVGLGIGVGVGVGVGIMVDPEYVNVVDSVFELDETMLLTRKSNCTDPLGKLYKHGELLLKSDHAPPLMRYDQMTGQ